MGKKMEYNKIIPYAEYLIHDSGNILSMQLNITNKCFSRCKSCRKYEWPDVELSLPDIKRILHVMKDSFNCKTIVLSGGEPLAHPYINSIIDEILKNQMKYGIITSAITNSAETLLKIARTAEWIQVSLDAADEKLYEEIRGINAYKIVIDNIGQINRIRKSNSLRKIKIDCTVSKTNVDQLDIIYVLASLLDCDIDFYPVHTWPELMLDYTDWQTIELFKQQIPKAGIKTNLHELEKRDEYKGKICVIKNIHCVIDADGSVYPCCRLMNDNGDYDQEQKYSYGNVKEQDIHKVFYSLSRTKLNAKLPNLQICKICDRYRSVNEEFEKYINNRKELFL